MGAGEEGTEGGVCPPPKGKPAPPKQNPGDALDAEYPSSEPKRSSDFNHIREGGCTVTAPDSPLPFSFFHIPVKPQMPFALPAMIIPLRPETSLG